MNTPTTVNTTTTPVNTTARARIRAASALAIPLRDHQIWSDDAPVYRLAAATPAELAWLARHPEANAESRGWRASGPGPRATSVATVLAAPAAYRAAAKRAYRRSLGLLGFAAAAV
jgi:hypothetical protein